MISLRPVSHSAGGGGLRLTPHLVGGKKFLLVFVTSAH